MNEYRESSYCLVVGCGIDKPHTHSRAAPTSKDELKKYVRDFADEAGGNGNSGEWITLREEALLDAIDQLPDEPATDVEYGAARSVSARNIPSNLQVSEDGRSVTIFDVRYDIELFRHLGIAPIGSRIEIIARGDGVVTLKRLPDETLAPASNPKNWPPRFTVDPVGGVKLLLALVRDGHRTVEEVAPFLTFKPESSDETRAEDGPCYDTDGCPTEMAVLKRFWHQVMAERRAQKAPAKRSTCGDGCPGCEVCRAPSDAPPEQVKTSTEHVHEDTSWDKP